MSEPTVLPVTEIEDSDFTKMHVVPVEIVGRPDSDAPSPGIMSCGTLRLPIAAGAQQIVARSDKRYRAYIRVQPGDAGNSTGFIVLGTQGQVNSGMGANIQGFRLVNGQDFTYYAKAELWVVGDGTTSLYVSVLDERFA
jgi:hypothetical protein